MKTTDLPLYQMGEIRIRAGLVKKIEVEEIGVRMLITVVGEPDRGDVTFPLTWEFINKFHPYPGEYLVLSEDGKAAIRALFANAFNQMTKKIQG